MDHVGVLRLSTRRAGGTVTVTVAGEVDLATTDQLRDRVSSVLAGHGDGHPVDRVMIEVGGVSFIDASGLGALVAMRNLAHEQDTPLVLSGISPALRRLLALTGLTAHLTGTEYD
jgi:anti-anti-sigma factor